MPTPKEQPTWTSRRVKTAPTVLPVTLATMKATLRLESTETGQDALLTAAIWAAAGLVEQCGATLITTVFQAFYSQWPHVIQLPMNQPVKTIDAITYVDEDGVTQTLAASKYRADVNSFPCQIERAWGESWPSVRGVSSAITVEYTAGYGNADTDIPRVYAAAVQAIAADIYLDPQFAITGTITGIGKTSQMILDLTRYPGSM